jgi:hypothetical protein
MDFVDGRGVQQTIPVVHSATSTTMCCGDATAAMIESQRIKVELAAGETIFADLQSFVGFIRENLKPDHDRHARGFLRP